MLEQSYRHLLDSILLERQKTNPSYSLRAFAKALELDSSRLSRVLNRKQGLSHEAAQKIAQKLGLNKSEQETFCLMVEADDGRSKKKRNSAKNELLKLSNKSDLSVRELELEDYSILEEWYNIAILEMMDSKTFRLDFPWIAKELDISALMAQKSIEKLKKLNLVEFSNGILKKTNKILKIDKNVPSLIMKSYYEQILKKAQESIYLQNVDERSLSSIVFSLGEDDKNIIEEEIKKFRSHLNELAENLATKNKSKNKKIYCYSTQLFKLSKGEI